MANNTSEQSKLKDDRNNVSKLEECREKENSTSENDSEEKNSITSINFSSNKNSTTRKQSYYSGYVPYTVRTLKNNQECLAVFLAE